MNVWTLWLDSLRGLLDGLAVDAGLGLGLAIIVGTLLLRVLLLPISWSVAYRGSIRQKKMAKLQPLLQRLKEQYAKQPDIYMKEMTALYRAHGLSFADGRSILAALVQMPVLLGVFRVLRNVGEGVRFLWVPNLLRPDASLAIIAGATTALMMLVNPDMPEQMRLLMIAIPTVLAIVAALNFCSALALYWATTNSFTAVQTVMLHFVIKRRVRVGTLTI
jgi:YidC/Oxa1 family membrane protein insertase